MEFDYSKLRGRIVEKYGSYAAFSRMLDITEIQVSKKLNGKARFSQEDIVRWSDLLDIDSQGMGLYFLCHKGLT